MSRLALNLTAAASLLLAACDSKKEAPASPSTLVLPKISPNKQKWLNSQVAKNDEEIKRTNKQLLELKEITHLTDLSFDTPCTAQTLNFAMRTTNEVTADLHRYGDVVATWVGKNPTAFPRDMDYIDRAYKMVRAILKDPESQKKLYAISGQKPECVEINSMFMMALRITAIEDPKPQPEIKVSIILGICFVNDIPNAQNGVGHCWIALTDKNHKAVNFCATTSPDPEHPRILKDLIDQVKMSSRELTFRSNKEIIPHRNIFALFIPQE